MKKTILLIINYYLPGYKAGGPIQTITNMVNAIGDSYSFLIVTSDRDVDDRSPYFGIQHQEWIQLGKALVRYLSPEEETIRTFKSIINDFDFDIVYLQSFFNPHYTILPLLSLFFSHKRNTPVLIAPRGEFAACALSHKSLRKVVYLCFFQIIFIHFLNYFFQCSSHDEENDLKQHLKRTSCFTALDFNAQEHIPESSLDTGIQTTQILKIVLLARIDIQKNIDYAIKVVSRLKTPVVFDIYGNSFDKQYALECTHLIEHIPENVRISLKGPVPHHEVLQTLQKYDLFFMPTKNENFGHVIHEALLAGLPVLISDQTPWHELESRNAGWEIPLDKPNLFVETLENFISLTPKQRLKMRRAALQYGIDVSNNQQTIQDNIQMFNSIIHPIT